MGYLTARAYKKLPLAERSVPCATDMGAAFAVVHESVVVSYTSFAPYGGTITAPPTQKMRLPTAAAEPKRRFTDVREAPVVGGREALVHASVSIEYLLMTVGYVGTGGPSSPPNMYMVAATTADAARYSLASGHFCAARAHDVVHRPTTAWRAGGLRARART